MAFHVFWPGLTCLTLFIVGVIILILRFGARYLRLRHTTLPDVGEWESEKAYDHRVSYA